MHYFAKLARELVSFTAKVLIILFFTLIGVAVSLALVTNSAQNAVSIAERELRAEGLAKRKVTPDSARIILGKNLRGTNIAELQSKVASSVNDLVAKLKALGVTEQQLQTNNYSLNPVYNTEGDIRSYAVNVSVQITLEKTSPQNELLSKIITAGTETGIDEVRGLNFYLAEQELVARELEDAAIKDAKVVAEQRAKSSGLRLGRVIRVDTGSGPVYPLSRESAYSTDGKTAAPIDTSTLVQLSAGQFDLEQRVTLVYETY